MSTCRFNTRISVTDSADESNRVLRREDIAFEDKNRALREDVRTLGSLVGDLIREQGGDELFNTVEQARLRAIRRREGNEKPGEDLASLVDGISAELALEVIRIQAPDQLQNAEHGPCKGGKSKQPAR